MITELWAGQSCIGGAFRIPYIVRGCTTRADLDNEIQNAIGKEIPTECNGLPIGPITDDDVIHLSDGIWKVVVTFRARHENEN